jgi:hypothetical protein
VGFGAINGAILLEDQLVNLLNLISTLIEAVLRVLPFNHFEWLMQLVSRFLQSLRNSELFGTKTPFVGAILRRFR